MPSNEREGARGSLERSPRPSSLLPLGAIAAGLGLLPSLAPAQVVAPAAPAARAASTPGAAPGSARLPTVTVWGKAETDQNSVRATTTTVGRGNQDIRDVPQSVTVVTEKLIEDRRADTVKEALHYTAGISFQAAEGGEEDIRLRGFSLTASGDIFADNVRDPAFYERDVFNFERIEVLRGSASMLFGRGSTGGIVNQVSKQPQRVNAHEVTLVGGSGDYLRTLGDFNFRLSDSAAVRLNTMTTNAENYGNGVDRLGLAPTLRWGIGKADEFSIGYYYLENRNGIHFGMPWLRQNDSGPISASNPGGLVPVNPRNYYGAASDYSAGYASYGTVRYIHRFSDGGELHSVLRQGGYDRDQRASTIRFCQQSAANPTCPVGGPTRSTLADATVLVRGGANGANKVQQLNATYLQTDYANTFRWLGRAHQLLGGVDLAREAFDNYALSPLPSTKALPRTTIGTPNDGASFDEGSRTRTLNRHFVAKAVGVYVQDVVEVVKDWKVLAGLRWDRFSGDYRNPVTTNPDLVDLNRTDSLWSKRVGVLWQPSERLTAYASYGTSFNTSGELYNYDLPGSNAPPEKSRNVEVGAKLELFEGRVSSRIAVFRSTKYNERNRDSPEGQPIVDFILSGERHASGVELDLAGRITPAWEMYLSYAWIPSAKVDKAAFGVAPSGERVGDRPSLTPRHSGSIFTTYQLLENVRVGGGVNGRGKQTPNRNPPGIVAPGFLTYDLLAEYAFNPNLTFKVNAINVTNKLYADSLYIGHYIPGQPRTLYASVTARF